MSTNVTETPVVRPTAYEPGFTLSFKDALAPSRRDAIRQHFFTSTNTVHRDNFIKYMELCYDHFKEHLPSSTVRYVSSGYIDKWHWIFIIPNSGDWIKLNREGYVEEGRTVGAGSKDAINRNYTNITFKTLVSRITEYRDNYQVLALAPVVLSKDFGPDERTHGLFFRMTGASVQHLQTTHINAQYEANDVRWEIDASRNLLLKATTMTKAALYEQKPYSFNFFDAYKKRLSTSKKERDAPIYGVELELSTSYSVEELIKAGSETIWLCAKQDSSITGKFRGKHEMVTLPATLKAHKLLWGKWFNDLDMRKFDQSTDTNNGMHVHVSKESFHDTRHQRDFAWFFTNPMCAEFMIDFSERGALNGYCAMPNWRDHGNPNATKVRRNIMQYLAGLRGAINVGSNKGTIEVRLFKGIVSYATVLKNLELVDAVFHFTAKGISYSANPMREFFKWLDSTNKNQYEALKEYISNFVDKEMYELVPDVAACLKFTGDKFFKRINEVHTDKLLVKDILHRLNSQIAVRFDPKLNLLVPVTKAIKANGTGALVAQDSKYLNRFQVKKAS